jgi:hypothetical protein
MTEQSTYRFSPRVRGGLIPGARTGQVLIASASLVAGVAVLRALRGPGGGLAALSSVVLGALIAWLPIRGRALDEWAPVLGGFASRRLGGQTQSHVAVGDPSVRSAALFRPLHVYEITHAQHGPIGVIADRQRRTLSGVIAMRGDSFALLSSAERDARVEAWASVLAALANSSGRVHRLQWLEVSLPDRGVAIRRSIAELMQHQDDEHLAHARESYAELVTKMAHRVMRHETFVVLTVSAQDRTGLRSPRDHGRLDELLSDELVRLEQRCLDAGLALDGALSGDGLSALLRRCCDDPRTDVSSSTPWPLAWQERWSSVRSDGTWHATYWVPEWPKSDVRVGFLNPLLLRSSARQRVSVVMAPIAPRRATRAAEYARTSAVADSEARKRHGFMVSARARREHSGISQRERELAEGHGAYRFSGYVTVSASNKESLERACARMEQLGALSQLEIRRLYGVQKDAFFCTLPLGRGCQ